jgi:hypothetical protein
MLLQWYIENAGVRGANIDPMDPAAYGGCKV